MQIHIGNRIYEFRNKKGYTQQQLADVLGVSAAAISKWENDVAYPDISTLPILARIFQVSVDELLNFEEQLSEEEVIKQSLELLANYQNKTFAEAFAMTKEIIRTYPTCEFLKLRLAGNYMYIMMYVTKEEDLKQYLSLSQSLCEEVIHSNTYEIRQSAGMLLCNLHFIKEEYDEAITIIKSLPSTTETTQLQGNIYMQKGDYEEALKLTQGNLYQTISTSCLNMTTLMAIATKQQKPEQVQEYIRLQEALRDLFHMQEGFTFAPITEAYVDKATALKNLERYIEQLKNYDNIREYTIDRLRNTLWFSHVQLSDHQMPKGMMKGKLSLLLQDSSLDYLREEEGFKSIVEDVKRFEEAE